MRPNGSPEQLEKRRYHAIELLKKGFDPSEVAAKVGSSLSSVYLWRDKVRDKGRKALEAKPIPGRPAKLNPRQRESLTGILLKGAFDYGYSTDLWTQRRVAEVIEEEFDVQYHPNHLWRFLGSLGWSCQKPEKRARERNEEAIRHWMRYKWPHIKKR